MSIKFLLRVMRCMSTIFSPKSSLYDLTPNRTLDQRQPQQCNPSGWRAAARSISRQCAEDANEDLATCPGCTNFTLWSINVAMEYDPCTYIWKCWLSAAVSSSQMVRTNAAMKTHPTEMKTYPMDPTYPGIQVQYLLRKSLKHED